MYNLNDTILDLLSITDGSLDWVTVDTPVVIESLNGLSYDVALVTIDGPNRRILIRMEDEGNN